MSSSLDPEELLLHDAFLRSLARSLVADAGRAEDLAQEVWAQVLARAPSEGTRLRAWLAGVARHLARRERRSSRRRADRELLAARNELGPSTSEILERESARRDVVEAVLELGEPYRSTLLLRYFENEPPRAIARRTGVPVETVRTRTRRGLELLRARLDREHGGDRRAWLALVAPLAALPPAVPLAAPAGALDPAIAKVLTMSTSLKIGAGVLAAACLALFLSRSSLLDGPALEAPRAGSAADLAEAPEQPSAEPGAKEERAHEAQRSAALPEALAARAPKEPFGALGVRVTWSDHTPAAGIGLRIVPWDLPSPMFRTLRVVTGADGFVALERVPAGTLSIDPFQGGGQTIRIEPGEEAEVQVVLPRGFDVAGKVTGEGGGAVEGAEVWLSVEGNDVDGGVVARSDAAGAFAIRSVFGVRWIGARHPALVASPLVQLFAGEGARKRVELVLGGAAGAVEGRVLDPRGQPVAGALVLAGAGGPARGEAPAIRTESGADGAFAVRGLAPGTTELIVRAQGHGIWRGEVEVIAGRSARLDASLLAGVALFGTVRDAEGQPAPGVRVSVGEYGPWLTEDRSGPDGAWRLEELEPGEIEVEVDGGSERGRVSARLHGLPGDALRWDCALVGGGEIAGRVQDERGAPLADWTVSLNRVSRNGEGMRGDLASTDGAGRFRFRTCPDGFYRLEAKSVDGGLFPAATAGGVRPGGGEVVLIALDRDRPSVRITGRILGLAGEPAPQALLIPRTPAYFNAPIETPRADGAFELGPYPPGEWVLQVEVPGEPSLHLGPRPLRAGETWELGTVRLSAPGSLRVKLSRPPGSERLQPSFALHMAGGRVSFPWPEFCNELTGRRLAPGEYELAIVGGCRAARFPFSVRSGEESALEVEFAPGLPQSFRVHVAPYAPWADVRVRVTDALGRCVFDEGLRPGEEDVGMLEALFAPGRYEATALGGDGKEVRAAFEVGQSGAAEPIVLHLD